MTIGAGRAGVEAEEAEREDLKQEIGAICAALEPLGRYFLSDVITRLERYLPLARDTIMKHESALKPAEVIDPLCPKTASEVQAMTVAGAFPGGDSLLAVLLAMRRHAGGN